MQQASVSGRVTLRYPAPLSKQPPVSVLAGEGEAAVGPPEQVMLLVVDEGGISPSLRPAFHLEVVQRTGAVPAYVGLATPLEPSHARIVYERALATTLDWRRVVSRVSMADVEGGLCNKNLRP
jgi:hypothetical protein